MNRQQGKQKLDFQGEPIYVGIDVHKKHWTVFIMSRYKEHKGFVQPPDAAVLGRYLKENFPGATYFSVYEAGFCGFWPHEALKKEGIHNIVVSPADVPSTDKEKKKKSDKVDCRKLCSRLRLRDLEAIRVPTRSELEDRELVRLRWRLTGDITRTKNRIKGMLNFYGIRYSSSGWSRAFIKWLQELELAYCNGTFALHSLVDQLERLTELKKSVARQLRIGIVKNQQYAESVKHLCSIPGVGLTTALILVTELGDIRRFPGIDQLCNYAGLVPTLHSSGEHTHVGNLTPRKNKYIMSVLIENAWKAAGKDPALMQAYHRLHKRMESQEAIIRIARKLMARIHYVLLNQTTYQLRMVA